MAETILSTLTTKVYISNLLPSIDFLQQCRKDWDGKAVSVIKDEQGKPFFIDGQCYCSVAHTKEKIVVAISKFPVGIDIEKLRYIKNCKAIALRFFETKIEDEYQFFRLFTAKEAVGKLKGDGLINNRLANIDKVKFLEIENYIIALAQNEYIDKN